jgi:hypothetical protein
MGHEIRRRIRHRPGTSSRFMELVEDRRPVPAGNSAIVSGPIQSHSHNHGRYCSIGERRAAGPCSGDRQYSGVSLRFYRAGRFEPLCDVDQKVTSAEVLKITLSIGRDEICHFLEWVDFSGNAAQPAGSQLNYGDKKFERYERVPKKSRKISRAWFNAVTVTAPLPGDVRNR